MKPGTQTIGVSASLATLAMAAALWCIAALVFQDSGQASISGIATIHENRAKRMLEASRIDVADLNAVEQETRRGVDLAPANPWGALRLAYVEAARTGRLGDRGLAALEHSYQVSPYGPQVTRWRLTFALQHWTELTPGLRRDVASEIRVASRLHPHSVQVAVKSVKSRIGRLAGHAILIAADR